MTRNRNIVDRFNCICSPLVRIFRRNSEYPNNPVIHRSHKRWVYVVQNMDRALTFKCWKQYYAVSKVIEVVAREFGRNRNLRNSTFKTQFFVGSPSRLVLTKFLESGTVYRNFSVKNR